MNFFTIKILIIIILASGIKGCNDISCSDFFTPRSVKIVRGDDIKKLEKKASEYDELVAKKIETAENAGNTYQLLGEKYLDRRLWDLSINSFEKALGYGRSTPVVHYSLGLAYANRGKDKNSDEDLDKAEKNYKKALAIQPDYTEAEYALGILLFYVRDNKEEGLDILNRVVRKERKFYRARFALARAYYELQNPEKALSLYEALYADIQNLPDSREFQEYKKNCKENIERLMLELSQKK